jgi:hypothetical protein
MNDVNFFDIDVTFTGDTYIVKGKHAYGDNFSPNEIPVILNVTFDQNKELLSSNIESTSYIISKLKSIISCF